MVVAVATTASPATTLPPLFFLSLSLSIFLFACFSGFGFFFPPARFCLLTFRLSSKNGGKKKKSQQNKKKTAIDINCTELLLKHSCCAILSTSNNLATYSSLWLRFRWSQYQILMLIARKIRALFFLLLFEIFEIYICIFFNTLLILSSKYPIIYLALLLRCKQTVPSKQASLFLRPRPAGDTLHNGYVKT